MDAVAVELAEVMICPASGAGAYANIQRTVANGVEWPSLAPSIAPESAEALQPLVDDSGELHFWGFRENSRDRREISPKPPQSWQRLVGGTRLLFIGKNRPTYTGVVRAILFDPSLSEKLWGSDEFGWVVGLVDIVELPGVTDEEVRAAAGFVRVQMSMPVPDEHRAAVYALLGVPETTIPTPQLSSLAQIDPDAPLSVWALAERRNEQSLLRRALIPAMTGICDLCGEQLPATFLRVAHVKQRAACSDAEKRDLTNVLVACVFCDIAFERGWLALADDLRVLVSASLPMTPQLRTRLDEIAGRVVAREVNMDSVVYHREHSFTP